VRAKLAAQTGVDHSIEMLTQVVEKGWFDGGRLDKTWVYFGSQSDEEKDPNVGTPLETAVNPSFSYEKEAVQNPYDNNANPQTLTVKGKTVGISGFLPSSTYGENADFFALKVLDCQSMINVNDGYKGGRNYSVTRNLERVLNHLGAVPSVNLPNVGTAILDNRPPTGYRNKYELLRAVGFDRAKYDRIKDFVTVNSWVDTQVVNPVPLSSAMAAQYKGISYDRPKDASGNTLYRYGHNVNTAGQPITTPLAWFDSAQSTNPYHNAIWEASSLAPMYIEMVERAPVNLNTAAREVLIALVAELQGFFSLGARRNTPTALDYTWMTERYTYDAAGPASEMNRAGSDVLAWLYSTTAFTAPAGGGTGVTGTNSTEKIVDEMIACRSGQVSPATGQNYRSLGFGGHFKSWAQFNRFVDFLVEQRVIEDSRTFYDFHDQSPKSSPPQKVMASRAMGDVLKANFNPNLHLNEANPNKMLFGLVDKTDLICNSTEGCFTPMGTFEIESLGYVVKPTDSKDALAATDNKMIAQHKLTVVVKLYDATRDTAQNQFYQGAFGPRKIAAPTTNNDCAVEIGPEPDNGTQPTDADYEGYISLSTLFNESHTKGQLIQAGGNQACPGWDIPQIWGIKKHNVWDDGNYVYVQVVYWDGEVWRWDIPKNSIGGGMSPIPNYSGYGYSGYPIPNGSYRATFYPPYTNPQRRDALWLCGHGIKHWLGGERTPPTGFGGWGGSGVSGINTNWGGPLKPKGTLFTTMPTGNDYPGANKLPAGDSLFGDQMHTHLRLDQCAHHHWAGNNSRKLPLGAWERVQGIRNYNDKTETIRGPYGPVDSTRVNQAGRFRIAKSYRLTPAFVQPGTTSLQAPSVPTLPAVTVSDLRIDGAYCEHNSAFGYEVADNFDVRRGAIAFWIKPNFHPEFTGKSRLLTSLTRFADKPYLDASGKRRQELALYLLPYHRFFPNAAMYGAAEEPAPPIGGAGAGQIALARPVSLTSIWSYAPQTGNGGGAAGYSPTINHKWHGNTEGPTNFIGTDGKLNHLRSNEWTHIVFAWKMQKGFRKTWKADKNKWIVIETGEDTIDLSAGFVNGHYLPGSIQVVVAQPDGIQSNDKKWNHKATNQNNSIRVGGEYSNPIETLYDVAHKYFADATIDEFYYWEDDRLGVDMGMKIATYGRYYKPVDNDPDSGAFISRDFPVTSFVNRDYPLPSPVDPPAPTINTGGGGGGGGGAQGTTQQVQIPAPAPIKMKVIAIQWTAVAEDYVDVAPGVIGTGTGPAPQARMKPVMYNYQPLYLQNQPPTPMSPPSTPDVNGFAYETVADTYVQVDGSTYGPYRNEPWSPIRIAHITGVFATGPNVNMRPPTVNTSLRYKTKFRVGLANVQQALNAVLITTPYVDDVTLFYTKGEVEYLNWTVNP
jgi:hypothetical protein